MAVGSFFGLSLKNRYSSWNMKRVFRSREKILILLVILTFLIVCIGPIFFLPDLRGGISTRAESAFQALKEIEKVAPEVILPLPPHNKEGYVRSHNGVQNPLERDIHVLEDIQRLKEKVNNDVLEKPALLRLTTKSNHVAKVNVDSFGEDSNKVEHDRIENINKQVPPPVLDLQNEKSWDPTLPIIQGGEDSDPIARQRREKVKEMTLHAWRGYKAYAWGKNELRPISKRGHTAGIFGTQDMGATIVDAMDTLYIMGLMDEFNEGKIWIRENLDFNKIRSEMSVFETNIRFVGGLLTLYALTGDSLFKDKSLHIAKKLLPAFETPTGIPFSLINVANGVAKNYAWASGGSSILSEFGTLHLEFVYLSDITGDPVFREKVLKIRETIRRINKPGGLYPNYFNPKTGKWGQYHTSIGALGDSFYEYLLKAYIQSGYKDHVARQMYEEAVAAIEEKLLMKSKSGLTYIAESKFDRLEHKMDHLACFSSGMFALGARALDNSNSQHHLEIGGNIANTCHESYIKTPTGLGPESFRFSDAVEARALKTSEKYYILRPEVLEGWFYMWKITHEQKYRDWAWDMVLSLEKYCRVEAGFSGISNVYMENPNKDDVQQSFLFAETFKYLYLIFSDDSLLSIDEWVFNTEAHPLPIMGHNSLYRPAKGEKALWSSDESGKNPKSSLVNLNT